jgi:NDP-sugar pyrophosphorylase family protein
MTKPVLPDLIDFGKKSEMQSDSTESPIVGIKTAVILAGGKGVRLKPFTTAIPKPLLPLGDKPILEIVIDQLVAAGISRVVLTLGYMSQLLLASIGDGSRWGINIESVFEREPLGTAGALREVRNLDDHFLVMNADVLTTLDYKQMFKYHLSRNAIATLGLSKRQVLIDYGVIRTTVQDTLQDYIEKPTIPYSVSMGINVLSNKSLDYLPSSGKFDMPELVLAMHRAGRTIHCYETDCYWKDIGRFDDYQQASDDFVENPSKFMGDGVTPQQ